jgi:uncharacterized protein (TIRG00374 family)
MVMPPSTAGEEPAQEAGAAEEPGAVLTPRRMLLAGVFIVLALVGLYLFLPKIAGLHQTWGQLKHGDPAWLALGAVLELLSIVAYAVLFATVFGAETERIDWRASIQIPLAGIAAIRLLAAAGAGGVAVSAWALRRAGMASRTIAKRMVAGYVLQYTVYLGALIVCGFGLREGVFAGQAPFLLTTLPALLCLALLALLAAMALVPGDFERRLRQVACGGGRVARLAARLATAPTTLGAGVRTAMKMVRELRPGLLGAVAYWGFDIAVLGVCCRAFGSVVPVAVLIMSYFLGTLGSLLPLPGGIGGVEGGMIGALVAFGVPGGQAVVGVLAYRAISFWLPTLPGLAGWLTLRATVRRWRAEDEALAARPGQNG